MNVGIIIVGYKNADDICQCFKALATSEYKSFDVVLVENGGDAAFETLKNSGLENLIDSSHSISYINSGGNIGYAAAINLALNAHSEYDAFWILNPDTQPSPQALGALVKRLSQGDCEAVGGVVCFSKNSKVQSLGGIWRSIFARAVSIGNGSQYEPTTVDAQKVSHIESEMDYISGASLLASKEFVRVVGVMDPDYFLYCEEVEWCLRAKKMGMKLGFSKDAIVYHDHGTTTGSGESIAGKSRLYVYLDERNKMLLSKKYYRPLIPLILFTSFFFIVLRYAIKGRSFKNFGYAVSGWKDGLLGKSGKPSWVP